MNHKKELLSSLWVDTSIFGRGSSTDHAEGAPKIFSKASLRAFRTQLFP